MYSKAVIHGGRPGSGGTARLAGAYGAWGEMPYNPSRHPYPSYHPLYRAGMDNGAEVPARGRKQVAMRSRKADSPIPPAQLLGEREALQLQKKYEEKVNHTKYELVAGFVVERGIIQAYTVYRVRLPFELTERRRRIILRYYPQGCQEVMLYVNKLEFEHYMPVGYRPLPPRKTKANSSDSEERQKKSRFKFFNLRR